MASPNRPRSEEPSATASSSPSKRAKTEEEKKSFLNIAEGNGGNYCFNPNDTDSPQHIGTMDCETCVGVYFQVNETMCFGAHINYEIQPANTTTEDEAQHEKQYEIGTAAFNSILRSVKDRLNDFQWQGNWGPITKAMKKSVRMICPKSGVDGKTFVGDAVAFAVREFLGIVDTEDDCLPRKASGMIVQHTANGDAEAVYIEPGETIPAGWTAIDADEDVPEEEQQDFACASLRADGTSIAEDGDVTEPLTERKYRYRWN